MTHVTADGTTTRFLEHPDQPQSHMNTSFGNDASQKQMTHVTADGTTTGFLEQSDKPQSHMNTSFGNDSSQKQMTHVTADGTTTGFLEQCDKPQSHMNTSFGNDSSQKQMTHVTADGTTTGFLEQSDKPQSHMNTSFGNDSSQKQMKDTNHFDSDELYDSTTDSSDNYVPDTTSENIDSEQEDGDKDGRRFPAIDEPAGMVALASAGHTPPPPKKRKPSEKMSSVGSTLSSGKGKNQKKCPWQPTEDLANITFTAVPVSPRSGFDPCTPLP
uniref:Uncharacterized protein n=1 Tax=Knipowitschia caucasica TaxID=637954 RepID=A0AAV2M6Y9_KNICA